MYFVWGSKVPNFGIRMRWIGLFLHTIKLGIFGQPAGSKVALGCQGVNPDPQMPCQMTRSLGHSNPIRITLLYCAPILNFSAKGWEDVDKDQNKKTQTAKYGNPIRSD